nr:VWA domain-containing protein [Anaerolineae bacterium]
MSFDAPWALGLLGVVALVAGVAASQMRRRGALLARLGVAERLAMLSTLDVRRRWVEARGVAVVFVLDISNSMDAEDVQPSRLERAKQSILDIVSGLDERVLVGLVLFAGDAFVQLPLTDDTDVLRAFVGAANTEMVTRQGTAIARGLSLAADVLDERVAGEALVVLMTDGENHDLDPTEAAKL